MTAAMRPVAGDVAAYLGVPETPDLADHVAAAMEAQAAVCDTSLYTTGLRLAAIRRAARSLAARSAPSGVLDLGDLGGRNLPRWDAEIESLEAEHRLAPIA